MTTMRARVGALLIALVAVFGAVGTVADAPAGAQTSSRAVVIVDLGSLGGGVRTSVIQFSGSVSGLEALRLAGADPQTVSYGPLGDAVCKLYNAGDEVTRCPGGWTYFRAVGGAGGWSQSSLGASNTTVHDGDVEGWRYGGGAPPFQSFCSVAGCAPAPAPTTAAPAVVPAGGGTGSVGSGSSTPPASGAGSPTAATGDTASGPAPPTTVAPGATATTGTGTGSGGVQQREGQQRVARAVRPTSAVASTPGGGSPWGVIVAVVLVVALVGGGVVLRRRRAGT